jgi:predicted carbohydrate-binding protein with CBM5 and CBM33 domain
LFNTGITTGTPGAIVEGTPLRANFRITGAATLSLLATTTAVIGHGSLTSPPSRIYIAWQEGPESPTSDAVADAIAIGGTQPLYDWNELVAFHPGDADYQRTIDYSLSIPDGQLASAGNPKFAGFDQVREDWPSTQIESGPFEFVLYASTPHDPKVMRAYITTQDWDPTQPLNWAQMEELQIGPVTLVDQEYRFNTILPERTGKQAVYVIWQRLDPVGEGFYSIADVDFGEGSGSEACAGDFDANQQVDGADMTRLLASWGSDDPERDLDQDGVVSGSDITVLLGNWGVCGADCNFNGVADSQEIADGASDCDADGVLDSCQGKDDCDGDGQADICQIIDGSLADCNNNLIPDACELADAASNDVDGDGVLDDCQVTGVTYTFEVDSDWGSGFVGYINLDNDSGECISGWDLQFDAEFQIQEVWDAVLVSQIDGRVRLVNESWNSRLCSGTTGRIGFLANGSAIPPSNMTINESVVNPSE